MIHTIIPMSVSFPVYLYPYDIDLCLNVQFPKLPVAWDTIYERFVINLTIMADLSSVFDNAHVRQYPKGQILLYQGERTHDVFHIQKGYVKVYDVTANGDEKLLLILGPGDIFPLVWTFREISPLHYFYETFDESEVCVIPRARLLDSIKKSHEVTKHLLEYFVNRTKDLMSRIECIESTSAKHKVAQVLTYLATAHGDKIAKAAYKVRIPITHQSIADMAGIARETASLQLKELETEKNFSHNDDHSLTIHTDRLGRFLGSGNDTL